MGRHEVTRAERNIAWIERELKIPTGKLIGKPFKLRDWQKDFLRKVYDNPAGTRTAILTLGRKNGKTALTAALLVLHFVGPESEPNTDLYSAARARDQAALVFDYARKMIMMNRMLSTIISLVPSSKQMRCEARGTYFKALSADAGIAFGLNPKLVIHDELGQVKGQKDDLYDALDTATGAQEEPLELIISTQAATNDDLLSIKIDEAMTGDDPSVVCVMHTAQGLSDPMTRAGLEAANPGLHEFMNAVEVERKMKQSMKLPASRVAFQNLNLNMRVSTEVSLVTREEWSACAGELPEITECEAVYGGLDLSRTRDLTASVLVGLKDDKFYLYPKFWLPLDGLKERSDAQRIPYFEWHKTGYLEAMPGKIIDRAHAAEYLYNIHEQVVIRKIGYDAWDYSQILPELKRAGFADYECDPNEGDPDEMLFEMMRQGFITMSPALRTVEQMIVERRIVHPDNPVLNFNMANCQVIFDTSGNRKLDKSSSTRTIDGAIAMVMALSIAEREGTDGGGGYKLASLFEDVA